MFCTGERKKFAGGGNEFSLRVASTVRVGIFLVEPVLTLGAATGATEFPAEPFLKSLGASIADQLDEGVAEAAVFDVTEFCDGARPQGPFAKWRRRDSRRGGVKDDAAARAALRGVSGVDLTFGSSRQKDGVHYRGLFAGLRLMKP